MKISEILDNGKLTLSFEVFPPKTDASFESVRSAVKKIAELHPSFMSVTYGAGGGTSKYTLDIAKSIKEKYGVPSVAHLTCVSSSTETVKQRINEFRDAGIENILALRGDIPENLGDFDRCFQHATDLIKVIKDIYPGFCIGGACYPESHPESSDKAEDIINLKKKQDAGFDFFVTQMFFDNNLLYNFLYRIREAGITSPVIPGIMPITKAIQIERAVKLSGSFVPQRFINLVDKFGNNPGAMMQAGIAYATDQIIDLYSNNITHIHVYSMNNPEVARKIMDNVSEIIN
ncbi:MAG: methylenetetrahydrofolate reductase [Clostridia bacterium]|nr:methylenetetrahydrofolate reductase [NAD(P)H] [Clostridia bacterium]